MLSSIYKISTLCGRKLEEGRRREEENKKNDLFTY
jgi:hypothetical protein